MALFSRIKVWNSGEVLFASDLNNEFNNLLDNTIPSSIEDASANVSAMQATADPGGVGSESLATSLLGEIQRLRFKLKQIIGSAQWYSTPVLTLETLITTAKIVDGNVTTAKIADGNVTYPKIAASNQTLGAAAITGSYTNNMAFTDVTNATAAITTNGRPIEIMLIPEIGGTAASVELANGTGTSNPVSYLVKVLRGATDVATIEVVHFVNNGTSSKDSPGYIYFQDTPSAGTYTYKFQVVVGASGLTLSFNQCRFLVKERV